MSPPPVHFERLPNGLGVLLCETHLAPVVEIEIWAGVGSADERPAESGLAHFHEHMLFKGTERRDVATAASPAPVNGSWRHRLVRLLGLEATLGDTTATGSGNSRRSG